MISFFLSVSFPRTRREVPSLRGDRGMFAYTGQNRFYWFSYTYYLFFRFCSLLPLSSANAATFPVKRGQLFYVSRFHIFQFYSPYFRSFVSAHTWPFRRLRRHLPRIRGRLSGCILLFPQQAKTAHDSYSFRFSL